MDYNAKDKTFELSIRVFTDDLEKALGHENGGKKFSVVNGDANDAVVEKYLRKTFVVLDAQKQRKPLTYIGKEQEGDATWIYFELPCPAGAMGWSVQNAILHELFDDQMNLLNLKHQTVAKSFIFKKDEAVHALGL